MKTRKFLHLFLCHTALFVIEFGNSCLWFLVLFCIGLRNSHNYFRSAAYCRFNYFLSLCSSHVDLKEYCEQCNVLLLTTHTMEIKWGMEKITVMKSTSFAITISIKFWNANQFDNQINLSRALVILKYGVTG